MRVNFKLVLLFYIPFGVGMAGEHLYKSGYAITSYVFIGVAFAMLLLLSAPLASWIMYKEKPSAQWKAIPTQWKPDDIDKRNRIAAGRALTKWRKYDN